MADIRDKVEERLYNRMRKNALKGFFKSAVYAAAIGAVIGLALFGAGLLPASIIPQGVMAVAQSSTWLAGALTGALTLMLPAGAFGATAGIQSTRDARRYFHAHEAEAHSLLPRDGVHMIVEPLMEQSPAREVSYREMVSAAADTSLPHLRR